MERRHVAEASEWIASGAPVYRTAKPDVPAMHLVSYFMVIDEDQRRLLLVAHRKAGLMLPMVTAGIVDATTPQAEAMMRVMQGVGVKQYRWGNLKYLEGQPIPAQRDFHFRAALPAGGSDSREGGGDRVERGGREED